MYLYASFHVRCMVFSLPTAPLKTLCHHKTPPVSTQWLILTQTQSHDAERRRPCGHSQPSNPRLNIVDVCAFSLATGRAFAHMRPFDRTTGTATVAIILIAVIALLVSSLLSVSADSLTCVRAVFCATNALIPALHATVRRASVTTDGISIIAVLACNSFAIAAHVTWLTNTCLTVCKGPVRIGIILACDGKLLLIAAWLTNQFIASCTGDCYLVAKCDTEYDLSRAICIAIGAWRFHTGCCVPDFSWNQVVTAHFWLASESW